jgi:hypothetical protein
VGFIYDDFTLTVYGWSIGLLLSLVVGLSVFDLIVNLSATTVRSIVQSLDCFDADVFPFLFLSPAVPAALGHSALSRRP